MIRSLASALRSPAWLLLAVGLLLGLNFPLGKLARQAGVPSLVWAALISLGVGAVLGVALLLGRRRVAWDAQHGRYFVVTALVSYALPNVLVLACIPRLGSGLTAMMFTLSPLLTALLSRLAGLRAPSALEYAGIAIGFVGALLVATARGEVGQPAGWGWVAMGGLIPVLLAVGNVYRTLDAPPQADVTWLSVGSHGVAALLLVAACLLTDMRDALAALARVPGAVAVQVLAAVCMFPLFFRLQAVGGPVLLSQIGTVAAAVGVAVGAGMMRERYAAPVWVGVGVITLGIGLTIWARRKG